MHLPRYRPHAMVRLLLLGCLAVCAMACSEPDPPPSHDGLGYRTFAQLRETAWLLSNALDIDPDASVRWRGASAEEIVEDAMAVTLMSHETSRDPRGEPIQIAVLDRGMGVVLASANGEPDLPKSMERLRQARTTMEVHMILDVATPDGFIFTHPDAAKQPGPFSGAPLLIWIPTVEEPAP